MDKKSFFRGFGVGVLFASIILGISFMVRTSDSFTKQRALELGMVYGSTGDSQTVLSSEKEESDAKKAEKLAEEKAASSEEKSEKKSEEKEDSSDSSEQAEKKEQTKKTKKTEKTAEPVDMKKEKEKLEKELRSEEQKLTINAGEWSTAVAKKLQGMGIIDDAAAFDKYLDKNGYSSFISAGSYKVSRKDTYQDLAKKITGR